jgi:hypothetical protein
MKKMNGKFSFITLTKLIITLNFIIIICYFIFKITIINVIYREIIAFDYFNKYVLCKCFYKS